MEVQNELVAMRMKMAEAERLRSSGKLQDAKRIVLQVLRAHPDYYGALHTLGLIEANLKNLDSSLLALTKANSIAPDSVNTLIALAGLHVQRSSRIEAKRCIEAAVRIGGNDAGALLTLAEILRDNREYDAALDAFDQALEIDPNWREASLSRALVLSHLGRNEESLDCLESLLGRNPSDRDVILALCSHPQAFDRFDLKHRLELICPSSNMSSREPNLLFAWAEAYHVSGEYDKAFDTLLEANSKATNNLSDKTRTQRNWQNESLKYLRDYPDGAIKPEVPELPLSLFVLGPSRSGKTTAEGILAAGSNVRRGYENPVVLNAIRETFQRNGFIPATQYALLPPQLEAECADRYSKELVTRAGGGGVFTNTSPARIHDAVRMASVLPNVRFAFVKRDRYDVVFNIFRTHYSTGNYYSYDLGECFHHVDWYYSMIDALSDKLSNISTVLEYESVLQSPRTAIESVMRLGDLGDCRELKHPVGNVKSAEPYMDRMREFDYRRN